MMRRAGTLALLVWLLQVAVAVADGRVPDDPAQHLTAVAPLWELCADGRWAEALSMAWGTQGGLYSLQLAAVNQLLGPSRWVQTAANLAWLGVSLGALVGLARRLVPEASAVAVAVAVASPAWLYYHRLPWVHAPETAGVLLTAWLLQRSPSRRAEAVAAGLVGAWVAALRPSGVVWVCTLLPLVRGRWAVLAAWGGGAAVSLRFVGEYLAVKGGAPHPLGPWLIEQHLEAWGFVALPVMALGVVRAARGPSHGHWRLWLTVGAWVVGPLVLMAMFRTGARDFLLWIPGCALLAARGYAALPAAASLGPALAAALALLATSLPASPAGDALRRAWRPPIDAAVSAWHVPGSGPDAATLERLLEAVCDEECHVLAPQGLASSVQDELGQYELFQLGHGEVELRALGDVPREGWRRWDVDALVLWDCPQVRERWLPFFPGLPAMEAAMVEELDLTVVFSAPVGVGCTWHWLAPEPLSLQAKATPFDAAAWRAPSEAIWAADPALRQRRAAPRATVRGRQR